MEFHHPLLGTEVEAIGGHYLFTKEEVLEHPSGAILYIVGCAVTDRSCCGPSGCGYAVVAGHVVSLRYSRDAENRPVSNVEPVPEALQEEVAGIVRSMEGISQVHFLLGDGNKKVFF